MAACPLTLRWTSWSTPAYPGCALDAPWPDTHHIASVPTSATPPCSHHPARVCAQSSDEKAPKKVVYLVGDSHSMNLIPTVTAAVHGVAQVRYLHATACHTPPSKHRRRSGEPAGHARCSRPRGRLAWGRLPHYTAPSCVPFGRVAAHHHIHFLSERRRDAASCRTYMDGDAANHPYMDGLRTYMDGRDGQGDRRPLHEPGCVGREPNRAGRQAKPCTVV